MFRFMFHNTQIQQRTNNEKKLKITIITTKKNKLFLENSPKHIKKFKKHKQTPSKKPQTQKKQIKQQDKKRT